MTHHPVSMVLIPGLAGHDREFAAQQEYFGHDRKVITLNPFVGGDLTIDGQADQLAQLVLRNRLNPVVLVGHSHGGIVALAMAVRRPDLVAGLVALDAPLMLPTAVRVAIRLPLVLLRTPLARPALKQFFAGTFTEHDPIAFRIEVLRRLEGVPGPVARAAVHGSFTYDTAAMRALQVPTLVIKANIPIRTDRLPHHIDAEEVTGVGHWPHVHAPGRVNSLLENFLNARDARYSVPGVFTGPQINTGR